MRRLPRHMISLSIISALALSACGIRGDLKTPPPLWDKSSKTSEVSDAAIPSAEPIYSPEPNVDAIDD